MQITPEKIAGLQKIYDNLDVLNRNATEAILAAKEFKNNLVLIKRKDGKEDEVREAELWEEIKYLGAVSEGYEVLKRRYPKAFEAGELQKKQAEELNVYCMRELGINPVQLRLIDIINLFSAMLDSRGIPPLK